MDDGDNGVVRVRSMFFFEKINGGDFYDTLHLCALYTRYIYNINHYTGNREIVSNIFYCTYINENIYMVDCSLSKQ